MIKEKEVKSQKILAVTVCMSLLIIIVTGCSSKNIAKGSTESTKYEYTIEDRIQLNSDIIEKTLGVTKINAEENALILNDLECAEIVKVMNLNNDIVNENYTMEVLDLVGESYVLNMKYDGTPLKIYNKRLNKVYVANENINTSITDEVPDLLVEKKLLDCN